jgi:hypothetical protein
VTDGTKLYLRQKAFDLDLGDANEGTHIIPIGGFLDGQPQHRTGWSLSPELSKKDPGDIMIGNGKDYYEVKGFPLYANHSYFDPRLNGYTLSAGTLVAAPAAKPADAAKARRSDSKDKKGGGSGKGTKVTKGGTVREVWRLNIPITGKAIAMAGDVVFVAGEPMKFEDPSYENYVAAYNGRLGGRLLAVSASDGKKLAEYKLASAPAWDGIAAAAGRLYISGVDGSITCFSER